MGEFIHLDLQTFFPTVGGMGFSTIASAAKNIYLHQMNLFVNQNLADFSEINLFDIQSSANGLVLQLETGSPEINFNSRDLSAILDQSPITPALVEKTIYLQMIGGLSLENPEAPASSAGRVVIMTTPELAGNEIGQGLRNIAQKNDWSVDRSTAAVVTPKALAQLDKVDVCFWVGTDPTGQQIVLRFFRRQPDGGWQEVKTDRYAAISDNFTAYQEFLAQAVIEMLGAKEAPTGFFSSKGFVAASSKAGPGFTGAKPVVITVATINVTDVLTRVLGSRSKLSINSPEVTPAFIRKERPEQAANSKPDREIEANQEKIVPKAAAPEKVTVRNEIGEEQVVVTNNPREKAADPDFACRAGDRGPRADKTGQEYANPDQEQKTGPKTANSEIEPGLAETVIEQSGDQKTAGPKVSGLTSSLMSKPSELAADWNSDQRTTGAKMNGLPSSLMSDPSELTADQNSDQKTVEAKMSEVIRSLMSDPSASAARDLAWAIIHSLRAVIGRDQLLPAGQIVAVPLLFTGLAEEGPVAEVLLFLMEMGHLEDGAGQAKNLASMSEAPPASPARVFHQVFSQTLREQGFAALTPARQPESSKFSTPDKMIIILQIISSPAPGPAVTARAQQSSSATQWEPEQLITAALTLVKHIVGLPTESRTISAGNNPLSYKTSPAGFTVSRPERLNKATIEQVIPPAMAYLALDTWALERIFSLLLALGLSQDRLRQFFSSPRDLAQAKKVLTQLAGSLTLLARSVTVDQLFVLWLILEGQLPDSNSQPTAGSPGQARPVEIRSTDPSPLPKDQSGDPLAVTVNPTVDKSRRQDRQLGDSRSKAGTAAEINQTGVRGITGISQETGNSGNQGDNQEQKYQEMARQIKTELSRILSSDHTALDLVGAQGLSASSEIIREQKQPRPMYLIRSLSDFWKLEINSLAENRGHNQPGQRQKNEVPVPRNFDQVLAFIGRPIKFGLVALDPAGYREQLASLSLADQRLVIVTTLLLALILHYLPALRHRLPEEEIILDHLLKNVFFLGSPDFTAGPGILKSTVSLARYLAGLTIKDAAVGLPA